MSLGTSPHTDADRTVDADAPTDALSWVDETRLRAAATGAAVAGTPTGTVARRSAHADLLPHRRRSAAGWGPVVAVAALAGVYVGSTLLWPLDAVAPTVTTSQPAPLVAPSAQLTWPVDGSAAVAVSGFSSAAASASEAVPMASITKVVTAMTVLERSPLAPGESGPVYDVTWEDDAAYWQDLYANESALAVPVGGTLSQYQLLQGMLIGSAGNYADRLVAELWDDEAAFVADANAWLAAQGLGAITLVDASGIGAGNTATPAALTALAAAALADPVFAEIVGTAEVELPGAGLVENTNALLADGAAIGVKTGTLFGAYNLLAAREVTVDDVTLQVYAATLGQPSDDARFSESARLLDEAAAGIAVSELPAGTVVGTATTQWGTASELVTADAAGAVLWNGTGAEVLADTDLGDARAAGDEVGTVQVTGPVSTDTAAIELSDELGEPSIRWRLTHPLQLFGLG